MSEIIESKLRKGVAFIPKGIGFYAFLISLKKEEGYPFKVDKIGITNYNRPGVTAKLAKTFYGGIVAVYPAIEVYIDNGSEIERATTMRLVDIDRRYGLESIINKKNYQSVKKQVEEAYSKGWLKEYFAIPIILKLYKER